MNLVTLFHAEPEKLVSTLERAVHAAGGSMSPHTEKVLAFLREVAEKKADFFEHRARASALRKEIEGLEDSRPRKVEAIAELLAADRLHESKLQAAAEADAAANGILESFDPIDKETLALIEDVIALRAKLAELAV